ncbi:MAG: helix-turn-helix transcriptional regulator [Selenomonadaceae bacterium]|nr:helix-turn-helix transcriptional regulator [Selenomonadaceae bacterium]
MPKTRNAFALRSLYDDILFNDKIIRDTNIDKPFIESIQESWITTVQTYLMKYITKKKENVKQKKQIKKSEFGFAVDFVIEEHIEASKLKAITFDVKCNIEKHIVVLQTYSQKILDKLLLEGLNCDLKNKGNRVNRLIACYKRILEEFNSYTEVLSDIQNHTEKLFRQSHIAIFSRRLKQARQSKKMTQEKIADMLKMTRVGYIHYETGRRDPSMTMLIKFSRILDVSIEWLCGEN